MKGGLFYSWKSVCVFGLCFAGLSGLFLDLLLNYYLDIFWSVRLVYGFLFSLCFSFFLVNLFEGR